MGLRALPFILIAAAPLGCATMSRGEATTEDKLLRIERSVQPGSEVAGEVKQDGHVLLVQTRHRCDLLEVKKIHRTKRYELKNEVFAPQMVLLGIGAVPAGFGIAMLADADNVYPSDRRSRLYNSSGPTAAIGGGIALTIVGAAMMSVPIVDSIRALGTEEEEEDVTEPGPPLQRDVPCRDQQGFPSSRMVALRAAGRQIAVGATYSNTGQATIDLATSPTAELIELAGRPSLLDVVVGATTLGQVLVDPILRERAAREDQAWQALDRSLCRQAPNPVNCQNVSQFLAEFPNGAHEAEARKLLDPNRQPAGAQVAVSPEDIAKAEAARKAADAAIPEAQKAGAEACRKKCEALCKKESQCAQICKEEGCQ
jgi:hypothetical protein